MESTKTSAYIENLLAKFLEEGRWIIPVTLPLVGLERIIDQELSSDAVKGFLNDEEAIGLVCHDIEGIIVQVIDLKRKSARDIYGIGSDDPDYQGFYPLRNLIFSWKRLHSLYYDYPELDERISSAEAKALHFAELWEPEYPVVEINQ